MENSGFIKLHRSMTEWEWFNDIPTYVLFTKLLFLVNWKDKKWRGQIVKRGEVITSIIKLSKLTNLTIKQTRRALENLQSTEEIEIETTNKYTKIRVVNYSKYQNKRQTNGETNGEQKGKQKATYNTDEHYDIEELGQTKGKQRANKGQTKGKQRATTKEYKEDKELKNNNNIYIDNKDINNNLIKEKDKEKLKEKEREKEKSKRGREIPPRIEDVKAYCQERENGIDAEEFFDFYESKGWYVGKNKMKDWKACVRTWERNRKGNKSLVGKNGVELLPESERDHSLDDVF